MEIIYGIVAIIILVILLKLLSIPFMIIKWLIVNGVTGLILLFIVNLLGSAVGLHIEPNFVNTIVAGVFGIPGIIVLLLIK